MNEYARRLRWTILPLLACAGCFSPNLNVGASRSALLMPSNSGYGSFGTFHVRGAVAAPGSYPLQKATTLSVAVATAGGILDKAGGDVDIVRTVGKPRPLHFDLRAIADGKSKDPPIKDGDVILVLGPGGS